VRTLIVNAGSSSLKLRRLEDGAAQGTADLPGGDPDPEALRAAIAGLGPVDAVAHRVVHGGERFRSAVWVDDEVRSALEALTDLAPLHQPKSLAALDAVTEALPEVRAAACFDTAFHATLAPAATTYALPARWRERYGVRRYGFHGLSHAYAGRRAAELIGGDAATLKVVSCHLGAGASLAAIAGGRSVDTTMGFTPLDGLVMATRSGSVDPGLLLWLLEREAVGETEMADALEHESGLVGLAGTADMRELLTRDDETARLALDVYLHRLRGAIGAMAAAMDGIDVLLFTGGVGERAAAIRARTVDGLTHLGLGVDAARNAAADGDADIGSRASATRTLVVAAREDLEMERQVRALVDGN
jgi:acetate kinase